MGHPAHVIVHTQKYRHRGIQGVLGCHESHSPLWLMAEITLTLKRAPVVTTTGVFPLGAHNMVAE
jgi:hypothetical protein